MRRREFIAGLGSAATWPAVVRAQQGNRMRVGVLMAEDESDPQGRALLSGFTQGLADLGWSDSRNLRMEVRPSAGSVDRVRISAKELVEFQPDVILANATPSTAALQRETQNIPIVFVLVVDPVGAGFVAGLPLPGGNVTRFVLLESAMAGKWLQLLTEIAPAVKRVAMIFNPDTAPGGGAYYLAPFDAAARSLQIEPIAAPVRSDAEIETVITHLGRERGGGLVVPPDVFTLVHRAPIMLLATRNNVPAVYWNTVFAHQDGLLSYGPDRVDIFRRAALYVDRIFRGAKPADLPVQLPVKFEMTVNLKTAKALGLTVPQSILLRAANRNSRGKTIGWSRAAPLVRLHSTS